MYIKNQSSSNNLVLVKTEVYDVRMSLSVYSISEQRFAF